MHSIWQTKNHPATYRVHFLFDKLGPDAAAISQRLSRLDKQLRSACPASVVITGCRRRPLLRRRVAPHLSCDRCAHPLARDEGQAGYRLGRDRLKCRAWAYTTPARSGFFPSFCAPPLNKPHSFRPVVREASKDRMIRRHGRTETATRSCACAKLPLGLGFHGCAHLSRVDNRVLFSLPCLGGYHWLQTETSPTAANRTAPLVRPLRSPTRPRRRTDRLQAGTRQIEVPRLPQSAAPRL